VHQSIEQSNNGHLEQAINQPREQPIDQPANTALQTVPEHVPHSDGAAHPADGSAHKPVNAEIQPQSDSVRATSYESVHEALAATRSSFAEIRAALKRLSKESKKPDVADS
jgi:hypothetical protein